VAPIYPIAAGRTITFHPVHWHTPAANTSASWDLEEIKARRSRGEPVDLVADLIEPVHTQAEIRVVLEPGDVLCFSGAHLHASVPNPSGLTRFSIEIRTVDARDVLEGRGAPQHRRRRPARRPQLVPASPGWPPPT
jgi:ectoine hydroxylase-related dioxygenase (phytanoyl-CoA dioxygenase family)